MTLHGETVEMNSIERMHRGHFFTTDTMRFWKTRLPDCGFWYEPLADGNALVLFITTDKFGDTRKASIRAIDPVTGNITTKGQYATLTAAKRELGRMFK